MNAALQEFVGAISGFSFPEDCCLYCSSTGPFQLDHFPIPAEFGGTETVRACLHCHNMKDRVSESIANDYMWSCSDEVLNTVLTPPEIAFLTGTASLLPRPAMHMIGDFPDFPQAIRIMIGRRLREQIANMTHIPSIELRRR
jgi:hypothetical protein